MTVKDTFLLLLKDGPGSLSSTRFAFLCTVLFSNIILFGLWLGLSIYSCQLMPIPESVIILYSLANGMSLTGKVIQKYLEGKSNV